MTALFLVGLFFGCWAFQAAYVRFVHVCHEAGFFHHFFDSLPSVLILLVARAVQWLCIPFLVIYLLSAFH